MNVLIRPEGESYLVVLDQNGHQTELARCAWRGEAEAAVRAALNTINALRR